MTSRLICIAILFLASQACVLQAKTLDLLADSSKWSSGISGGQIELIQNEGSMCVNISADGQSESFPHISFAVASEDWRCYTSLNLRMRFTSPAQDIERKKLSFICYSSDWKIPGLKENWPYQQMIDEVWIEKDKWVDLKINLTNAYRRNLTGLELFFYENPPLLKHDFKFEIAQIKLQGPSGECILDNSAFTNKEIRAKYSFGISKKVGTQDGLNLHFDNKGNLALELQKGKKFRSKCFTGLIVKDCEKDLIQHVDSKVVSNGKNAFRQQGVVKKLNLECSARYAVYEDYIKVSGSVKDLAKKDRFVTAYFALPVGDLDWQWGQSISKVLKAENGKSDYEFVHNRYPMSSLSLEKMAGISISVPMDQPRKYRLVYNPSLGLYYVAFDLGLISQKNAKGQNQSQGDFSFVIYKHDPAWGFRSAIEKYYRIYPQCFETESAYGGWGLHRGPYDPEPVTTDDGYKFSWQPLPKYYKWNADHDVYNLYYIEPEFQQISMGDYEHATRDQVMDRLKKLAQGDPEELAKCRKLEYFYKYYTAHMTDGGMKLWGENLDRFIQIIAKATLNSAIYNGYGYSSFSVNKRDWIRDSNVGAMFGCNIDPDIPFGKGWFNNEISLKYQIMDVEKSTGQKVDGLALDCLVWGDTPDTRRDNFQYSDFPISHYVVNGQRKLMLPSCFSSIEWLRDLRSKKEYKDMIIMANLGSAKMQNLAFVANELDVLGIENTHVPDPDFIRTIANNKPVTDLHYSTVPEWRVKFNLLHGVFPGQGHENELLLKYCGAFREITKARWQPVTGLRADSQSIRIERYGAGDKVYFVVHNADREKALEANLTLDKKLFPNSSWDVTNLITGEKAECSNYKVKVSIDALDTQVLTFEKK